MPDLAVIEGLIAAAGIPIESVKMVQGQIVLGFGAGVTPQQEIDAAAIAAAYDDSVEVAAQAEIDQARTAIIQIRNYLQKQLVKVTPDTPTVIVATIKAIANGNTYLARIMTNQVGVMNSAHGWSLTLNPTTAPTRNQYIETVEIIVGLLP